MSQVGADINAMATHAWMAHPLQYVCGLGPRKARALLSVCHPPVALPALRNPS